MRIVSRTMLFLLLLSILLVSSTSTTWAHARKEVGPYAIVVGWRNEPNIVGERNQIIIRISEDETPVAGLEANIDVSIHYGGRTYRANLNPMDSQGWYSVDLVPTIRGQYSVRLTGDIGELELDEMIEPEEVLPPSVLHFPKTEPDSFDLEAKIEELESRLQSTQITAGIGAAVALLALTGSLLGYRRSSRAT